MSTAVDDLWRWLGLRTSAAIYRRSLAEEPKRDRPISEWILSAEERRAGLRRPLRFTYAHDRCGQETIIDRANAEAMARDPLAFKRLYCGRCRRSFPAGRDGEFCWKGSTERVGS